MRKEIILPPHLYDRIKTSAGEHGGIGNGHLFDGETPWCAHGHAWGTYARFASSHPTYMGKEPELGLYISQNANDLAVASSGAPWVIDPLSGYKIGRVSFQEWCELLNVKRGQDEDYVQSGSSAELQAVQS